MAIIPKLSTSIMFFSIRAIYYCQFRHAVWWKSPYGYSKLCNINTQKKLNYCVAIFTILYDNYYPPHGKFELICIGNFSRRICVNFTQQYGKNRQRCQQNIFYYARWQLLLYFYREFPSKILPVRCTFAVMNLRSLQNFEFQVPIRTALIFLVPKKTAPLHTNYLQKRSFAIITASI